METRTSEFDRPISLYHLLQELIQEYHYCPTRRELMKTGGVSENVLEHDLAILVEWKWIEITPGLRRGILLKRPTENIFLVPRPIQEMRS